MSDELAKGVYLALLPPGSLWILKEGGDLDLMFDGLSDGEAAARVVATSLAYLRDPAKTPILSDLEREFGIIPDETETDAVRRARVAAAKSGVKGKGTAQFMEAQLRKSGFDVYVHENNPPADPQIVLLEYDTFILCGDDEALCGDPDVICASSDVRLVVDGPIDQDSRHTIPPETWTWTLYFFVGGAATRDGGGYLTDLAPAAVPLERYDEFIKDLLRYKPLGMWGLIYVAFV